jgi:beta-fructofuranosidase
MLAGHLLLFAGLLVLAAGAILDDDAAEPEPEPEPQLDPDAADAPVPPAVIGTVRRFRHRLLADPDRPTYHFVIPEDYAMPFDPNGAIFWKGRYHLFYIYQDRGAHCYGHASSLDLLHWRQHPPALVPGPGDIDRGMFSGNCFVNKRGEATMIYHGVGAGNCIATASDDLLDRWTKLAANPVVGFPPEGAPYRPWDPHGWLEDDTYYSICGGERPALFKASELERWRYVGDLLSREMPDVAADEDLSCPDLFPLGDKHVLVCISHRRGARYYVGDWKGEQFHPEVHERLSWSDNLYFAPESLADPAGRRIMWTWIFDQRPEPRRLASGWSGEMALPRELTLGPDRRLRLRPVEELKRLRYDECVFGPLDLQPDAEQVLEGISGDALELFVEIEPQEARHVGVIVRRSPDGQEGTRVYLDTERKQLAIGLETGPFAAAAETITLRIFVDRSIIEAFADDRQAVVRRVYPSRSDCLGVSLFASGGGAAVRRVVAWKMFPSNPY